MNDHNRLIERAKEWRGDALALVTVVSTWGSAPRPRGSHMLVNADGRFEGSVSGGCVEGDVLQMAADVIATGAARMKTYGVVDDSAWDFGLPCGGDIAVLVQPVGEDGFPPALFERIAQAQAAGETLSISTDLASGRSRMGISPAAFVNTYQPPRRMLIIGAVQIAQTLAALARQMAVVPIIIDPRGRFLTEDRFPGVTLDDRWPDEAVAAYAPDAATAVITLSHDPKIDDPALIAALQANTGYIAALGSRKSHAARCERLGALGFADADIARIDGPAGLDIGAVGAAEIALSIAAGMIEAFNARA